MSAPRTSVGAARWLALSLGLCSLGACGGPAAPPPNPNAVVGTFDVMVTANGVSDNDVMTVILGSSQSVLLTFTYGFTPVRAQVTGSTGLTLPRQDVDASHATGPAQGLATGNGTIDAAGAVDITLHLSTQGFAQPDGGTSNDVDYHIAGTRQTTM